MNLGLSKISLLDPDLAKLVEDKGAKTVAFFCRNLPVVIDARLIEELKNVSRLRNDSNVRICLHDGPDASHHDMIALERRGRYYRPHKHARKGDTFHMIEGKLGIFSFDVDGNVTDAVVIGPGEIYRTAALRLCDTSRKQAWSLRRRERQYLSGLGAGRRRRRPNDRLCRRACRASPGPRVT